MSLEVREYKDLDLRFIAHPVTKDVVRRTGNAAIIGALKNLILTNLYEKPFQPEIGSNVRKLLFENLDTITASAMEREIGQILTNHEPRVRVSRVEVNADFDNNGFKVYLEFFIVNREEPISINFFLERVR